MKRFIYSIIAMLGILMPTSAWAQGTTAGDESYNEAYAVLVEKVAEDGTGTRYLTLYYDEKKSSHTEGLVVDLDKMTESPELMQSRQMLNTVIFDESFSNCRPTSTNFWFGYCMELKSIVGLQYLNTSEVTDMSQMFIECGIEELDLSSFNTSKVTSMNRMFGMCMGLKSLNISSFDTSNVTDMEYMFNGCESLTTIYAGSMWTTAGVENTDMFGECRNLVGGNGTAYDPDHIDNTYARIDAAGAPGYFTGMGSHKEQAATPTFDLENNRLVMATETPDAIIYYKSADWTDYSEVDSLDRILTAGIGKDDIQYTEPIELNRNMIIKAYAAKEDFEDSTPNTLVYDYASWMQLYDYLDYGRSIYKQAYGNEYVEQNYVEELAWALNEGEHMYSMRVQVDRSEAIYFTDVIRDMCKRIEEQLAAANVAEFDGNVLTVQGQLTMNTALEKVGGSDKVTNTIAAIVWNSSEAISSSDLQAFTNPNLLIFVKDAAKVPDGTKNVIINGVAKSIVLSNTASGNNNFYSPMEFTAESISYTREFKQTTQKDVSRGWEGIALPFTVQTFTHENHGAISPFGNDASSYHFWLHQMTDKGLEKATTIEAGYPYIISMPNSSSYPDEFNQAGKVTFAAQNVQIPVTLVNSVRLADGSIAMVTAFSEIEPSSTYALNVGAEVDGHVEGSVFVKEYRTIRPFEVYTFHEGQRNSASRIITIASIIGGSNNTTDIVDVNNAEDANEIVRVHSLSGSLLIEGKRGDIIDNLPRGIYIIGGKKIIKR